MNFLSQELKSQKSFFHTPGAKYAPVRPGAESDTPEVKEYERIRAEKEAL